MPAKKPTVKKIASAKKPIGLTSAIGPKATSIVVICVMAGGIAIAARQQQVKPKDGPSVMTADVSTDSTGAAKRGMTPVVSTAISGVALAPAATMSHAGSPTTHAVSVTGCLEKTDEGFRLKDTAGAAAPKSRSWKSGFIKKGPATLDVVDASHALQLGNQVGHRVTVTGALVDREMRADSVHRVATSCKAN